MMNNYALGVTDNLARHPALPGPMCALSLPTTTGKRGQLTGLRKGPCTGARDKN